MSVTDIRRANLERGNVVRLAIVRCRREVRAGRLSLGDALVDPAVQGLLVWDVLCWLPGGRPRRELRADRLLGCVSARPLKRVGELTDRQKQVLVTEAAR